MAGIILPDWRLAQIVLPAVRQSKDFITEVRELELDNLFQDMPSTITRADLADVESLIRKLEAIASED
jgi:hypothetical protein